MVSLKAWRYSHIGTGALTANQKQSKPGKKTSQANLRNQDHVYYSSLENRSRSQRTPGKRLATMRDQNLDADIILHREYPTPETKRNSQVG
jgi:hypothetical protein